MAAVSSGTSHVTTKRCCEYTTLVDIQNTLQEASHSIRITCKKCAASLHESGEYRCIKSVIIMCVAAVVSSFLQDYPFLAVHGDYMNTFLCKPVGQVTVAGKSQRVNPVVVHQATQPHSGSVALRQRDRHLHHWERTVNKLTHVENALLQQHTGPVIQLHHAFAVIDFGRMHLCKAHWTQPLGYQAVQKWSLFLSLSSIFEFFSHISRDALLIWCHCCPFSSSFHTFPMTDALLLLLSFF